jgi:hypothetical protein
VRVLQQRIHQRSVRCLEGVRALDLDQFGCLGKTAVIALLPNRETHRSFGYHLAKSHGN